jgi:hypothetical protein
MSQSDPDCAPCAHRTTGAVAQWCAHPAIERVPMSRRLADYLRASGARRILALYGTLCGGTRAPAWCPLRETKP